MSANTMMLIFNCLIIFILLSGMIVGIFRGGKKTIYKVITTILFYIVLFATIDHAAEYIVGLPIIEQIRNSGVELPAYLAEASTIKEACEAFLIAQEIEASELVNVAMALSIIISKIIYCVLYLTIVAFVYWIITSIVWVLIRPLFGGKYKTTKTYKYDHFEKTKTLRNKHRLIGGCFGFMKKIPQALLVIIMVTGVINLLPAIDNNNSEQVNLSSADINSDELKAFIEKYNLGEFVKFVDMYRNTTYVNTLSKVEIGGVSVVDKVFDKLTSGKYKDYRLDLSSEMAFILSTGVKVLNITGDNFDFNTYTAEQQKQLVEVLKDITDSELIMSLIPISVDVALSLKMIKEKLPEGLELNPAIFNDVDWNSDIENICDTAIELINLTDGLQNIQNLDYLNMDPKIVNNLALLISKTSFLLKVVPPLVEYTLQLEPVKNMIGDLTISLENILWSQEIINMGDIYEKFVAIGISSFENIFGQIQEFEDEQFESTKTLISSIFTSEFISQVFPGVFNVMMAQQPENIRQLFQDIEINEWENEFITLVDLAKEIKDSGYSVDKIDLNIIKSVSVDTILRSDLLTHGMVNIFTTVTDAGSIGNELGLSDFIYVPLSYRSNTASDYGKWFESVDKDNNVVHGELYKILTGLQNIIKTIPPEEVDFSKLPQYILQINDSYLDGESEENKDQAIFNSIVLKTSISKLVSENEAITDAIIIPGDAVTKIDDINVIKQAEIEKMIKGIKALGVEDFTDIKLTNEMIKNLNEEYDNDVTKKNIDVILESKIINLTLTNLLDEKTIGSSSFVIPTEAKETQEIKDIKGVSYKLIKQDEIRKVITAFTKINVDINNPQFDIKLITDLSDEDIDTILESKIINYNLTNKITELGTTGNAIVIPNDPSVIDNGYINNNEVKIIVKSLRLMDIADFSNIEINNELLEKMMTYPNTEEKNVLRIALDSKILAATLSQKVNELDSEKFTIPVEAKETLSYQDINNISHTNIKTDEFENMIKTILSLNIDILNPNFEVSIILNLNDESIDDMLKSKIIHYNLTKNITEVNSIVIPESNDVIDNGYINPIEIKAIVKTLKVFNIDNFDSITVDKSIITKLVKNPGEANQDTTNIKNMLDSHILQATISDKIMGTNALIIPEEVKEIFGNKSQITKEELTNVVVAIAISNLNVDEFKLANIYELNNSGKLIKMLNSRILHFNISKTILDTSAGILVIPEDVVKEGYIIESEISNIVKSLEVLGVTDTVVELTPTKLFNLLDPYGTTSQTKLDVILNSKVLHATISQKILDINSLKIVKHLDVHYVDKFATNYIAKQEIKNTLTALKELIGVDATSFDNINFGPDSLKNKNVDLIFDSIIVRSTVSDLVAKDTMIEEIKDMEYCSYAVTTIKKQELLNVLDAFGEKGLNINGSSFNDGIDVSNVSKLSDAQLSVILKSKILHQRISNIIFSLSNVHIVESVIDHQTTTLYIKENEIKALVKFANGGSLSSIKVSQEDVISLLTNPTLVENIKGSLIMRATFGEIAKDTMVVIPPSPVQIKFPEHYFDLLKEYGKPNNVSVLNDKFFSDFGNK